MIRHLLAAVGLVSAACTTADAIDLHQFWDARCSDCHGHSAAFARSHLTVKDGVLIGRHRSDLKQFLATHEAGSAQSGPLYAMLLAQASTVPVFQQKCAGCHGTAAEFARSSLRLRDGVVIGRENGLAISEFLKRHGRLAAEEAPIVVESLTRVLGETGAGTSK